MQQVIVDKNELYTLIKQAVREVLQEEEFRLRMENLLEVSDKEMEDIEKIYGKPGSARDIAHSETIEV